MTIRRNPSVTGGYSLWTKVRRKGRASMVWGPVPPWRDWNHEALVSSGTGRGPRPLPPPLAEAQSVHRGYGAPGRCFRRVPPEPPGHNKACTPPLFTEGLPIRLIRSEAAGLFTKPSSFSQLHFRSRARTSAISAGRGEENSRYSPATGWVKPRVAACRAWRENF